jgi:hypothetical protein
MIHMFPTMPNAWLGHRIESRGNSEMGKRFYLVTRDLHLYLGLFISPFVLVFAISVFFLVHSWIPGAAKSRAPNTRAAAGLQLPPNLEQLSGRDRVNALRGVLDQAGVKGEVTFIRYIPKEHRLVVPVTVPGRETTVDINLDTRMATIEERSTGVWDAVVVLHKLPGPHGGDIRMNWVYLRIWRWLADATVLLVLFSSISGIYLWAVLRAERRIGLALCAAGTFSFLGIVYALCH